MHSVAAKESGNREDDTSRALDARNWGQSTFQVQHPDGAHPQPADVRIDSSPHYGSAVQPESSVTPQTPVAASPTVSNGRVDHRASPGPGAGSFLDRSLTALDSVSEPSSPQWINAGARRAEAAFEDPALGWIGVRAQLDASGVHAVLLPGSPAAAQSLASHLAGLSAYLADHHSPVESLQLEPPAPQIAEHGTQMGLSHGDRQAPEQGFGSGGQTTSDERTYDDSTHAKLSSSSGAASVAGAVIPPQDFISHESRYISVVV